MLRLIFFLTVLSFTASAQMKLTIEQLKSFISSSKQMKHDDKKVAEYLRKVKMTEKLDNSVIDELLANGAGPKTVDVLRDLRDASRDLPGPRPAVAGLKVNAPPPIPLPSKAEQDKVFEQAKEFAVNYTKQLPNFICVQITRRYYDPSGLEAWHQSDVLHAKLSYFEQKETYQLMSINGVPPKLDMSMDKVGGSRSSGEFGSLLKMVFEDKSHARFQFERLGKLRDQLTYVYSYFIAQPDSSYQLVYEDKQDYRPALRGTIHVDKETQVIVRLTLEAVDVPQSFPIQGTNLTLDYSFQTISDQQFLLPLRAEIKSRSIRLLTKNEMEFKLYRKFGADTSIKFDDIPLPESQTKEQPIK